MLHNNNGYPIQRAEWKSGCYVVFFAVSIGLYSVQVFFNTEQNHLMLTIWCKCCCWYSNDNAISRIVPVRCSAQPSSCTGHSNVLIFALICIWTFTKYIHWKCMQKMKIIQKSITMKNWAKWYSNFYRISSILGLFS